MRPSTTCRRRPLCPGNYTCKTALAIQVYSFSNKVYCVSLNGSTSEYNYSRQLHDGHSAYIHRDNEYSLWKFFSFKFKQVHYNFVYIQLLVQANPTGLLEVQLLGDLFSYWRHLLQEFRVLLISTIGTSPPATTSTGALGKYDFMYAKT
jgi:hypothetical protein